MYLFTEVLQKGSGEVRGVKRVASVETETGVVLWASIVSHYGHNLRDWSKVRMSRFVIGRRVGPARACGR